MHDCRGKVLTAWQERKQDEKTTIGFLPHLQPACWRATSAATSTAYPAFLAQ
jgi:hypothetical protein